MQVNINLDCCAVQLKIDKSIDKSILITDEYKAYNLTHQFIIVEIMMANLIIY